MNNHMNNHMNKNWVETIVFASKTAISHMVPCSP